MLRIRDKNVLFSGKKVSLISFRIHGTTYQAEEGMTWESFINSSYNSNGDCWISGEYVEHNTGTKRGASASVSKVLISDVIINNEGYLAQGRNGYYVYQDIDSIN